MLNFALLTIYNQIFSWQCSSRTHSCKPGTHSDKAKTNATQWVRETNESAAKHCPCNSDVWHNREKNYAPISGRNCFGSCACRMPSYGISFSFLSRIYGQSDQYICNCFVCIFFIAPAFHMGSLLSYWIPNWPMISWKTVKCIRRKKNEEQRKELTQTETLKTDCNHTSNCLLFFVWFCFVLCCVAADVVVVSFSILRLLQNFRFFVFVCSVFTHFMRCTSVIALCVNGHVSILMIQIWRFGVCVFFGGSDLPFELNFIAFWLTCILQLCFPAYWYNTPYEIKSEMTNNESKNEFRAHKKTDDNNNNDRAMENKLLALRPLLPPSIIFKNRNDYLFSSFSPLRFG